MPEPKKHDVSCHSKFERQKPQTLYTHGGAGFVHNLVEANNLSVSKVRQFLSSVPSCTKFAPATCKFKRKKILARFKHEIRCMGLAYIDKVAKDNNDVKCLLVRQDLLVRTVDAERMKTKESTDKVLVFLAEITGKIK